MNVLPGLYGPGYWGNIEGRGCYANLRDSRIRAFVKIRRGNVPAERAYTKIALKYLDTIQMYYEDTGWTDFKVYEYIL